MRVELDESYDFGMPAVDAFLRDAYSSIPDENYVPTMLYGSGEPDTSVWIACADLNNRRIALDPVAVSAALDELDREGFPLEPRIKAWIEAKIS